MTARAMPLLWLTFGVLAVLAMSVAVGPSGIGPGDVLAAFGDDADATVRTIVVQLRLPRTILAALVGGSLALSGATFQALLRNPLAEPYVLGISGGAAVGAVFVVVVGWNADVPGVLAGGALVGAAAAMALVLKIARAASHATVDVRVLILAGVIVGAAFNAVIMLLLSVADVESFRSAIFWMMGNLSGATWTADLLLVTVLTICTAILFTVARPLNLMASGDDVAFHLGVSVHRVRWTAYVVGSALVGASVAVAGVIGFVGLIVPHAVRLAFGSDHQFVLPASLLAGAGFLAATDSLARVVIAPAELPTGVVTALVGVPVFVTLLVRAGGMRGTL